MSIYIPIFCELIQNRWFSWGISVKSLEQHSFVSTKIEIPFETVKLYKNIITNYHYSQNIWNYAMPCAAPFSSYAFSRKSRLASALDILIQGPQPFLSRNPRKLLVRSRIPYKSNITNISQEEKNQFILILSNIFI